LRLDSLITVTTSMLVFYFAKPCGSVRRYQRFGVKYYLHPQDWISLFTYPFLLVFFYLNTVSIIRVRTSSFPFLHSRRGIQMKLVERSIKYPENVTYCLRTIFDHTQRWCVTLELTCERHACGVWYRETAGECEALPALPMWFRLTAPGWEGRELVHSAYRPERAGGGGWLW
jgi:hypothetical protein